MPMVRRPSLRADLEITLGNQLLQPRILGLQLLQAPDLLRLKPTETLTPRVNRLLADSVPLGDHRDRVAIRLADHRHHLLFRETRLAHCSLRSGASLSRNQRSKISRAGQYHIPITVRQDRGISSEPSGESGSPPA